VSCLSILVPISIQGASGSTVAKVLRYKSEGRWLDPSWCQWILHWYKIPPIAPLPGGKEGWCARLTTLPPSCTVVTKSGNLKFLETFGPVQACNGIALPLTLLLLILAMFRIFLRSFARLRKANVSFVMSVCLSVLRSFRTEQFGSHLTDFHEILYVRIIRNYVEKIYCMQVKRGGF